MATRATTKLSSWSELSISHRKESEDCRPKASTLECMAPNIRYHACWINQADLISIHFFLQVELPKWYDPPRSEMYSPTFFHDTLLRRAVASMDRRPSSMLSSCC